MEKVFQKIQTIEESRLARDSLSSNSQDTESQHESAASKQSSSPLKKLASGPLIAEMDMLDGESSEGSAGIQKEFRRQRRHKHGHHHQRSHSSSKADE